MAQAYSPLSELLGLSASDDGLRSSFLKDSKAFGDVKNLNSSLGGMGEQGAGLLKQINANPQKFQSDYDQYLRGQKMGNNPANQQPLYSNATNEWYDYAQNKWRNIGDGWGEAKDPTPTDPNTPVVARSRPGYSYGSNNPYLMNLLGLSKPVAGSRYTPEGKKIKGKSQETIDITDLLSKGGTY